MPSEKKAKEYKIELENELKLINFWLDEHPECINREQLANYEDTDRGNAKEEYLRKCRDKKARKAEIEAALAKISIGTFGICEKCSREIDPARLEGNLARKYCISCAARKKH